MVHRNRVNGIAAAIFYWMTVSNWELGVCLDCIPVTDLRLNFRPRIPDLAPDPLISYKPSDRSSYTPWISALEKYLYPYTKPPQGRQSYNVVHCDHRQPAPPPNKVCHLDVTRASWGPCRSQNSFGWNTSEPCIFLEMLPPPRWVPEFFNDTNSLPYEMPEDLKSYIRNPKLYPAQRNTVWVSCEGLQEVDRALLGQIEYIPTRGFPGYYFYNNHVEGWLEPIVALRLLRPYPNADINIHCRAWSRTLIAETYFKLFIED